MNNVFSELINEFTANNPFPSSQHKVPANWECLDEIAIGDELSIIEHLGLYKVAYSGKSEIYVFVRTSNGSLIDFGCSESQDLYKARFE